MQGSEIVRQVILWALADVDREVMQDYPLLRRIPNFIVFRALAYLRRQEVEAQKRILKTGVLGWFWDDACQLGIVPKQEEILERHSFGQALLTQSADEKRLEAEGQSVNKQMLRRLVKVALQEVAGLPTPEKRSKDVWHHDRTMGEYKLITWVDVGGNDRIIEYGHAISYVKAPRPIIRTICAPMWLGVAGAAQWNFCDGRSETEIVTDLTTLITHFTAAFAKLTTV
jgi:hypothetical protein